MSVLFTWIYGSILYILILNVVNKIGAGLSAKIRLILSVFCANLLYLYDFQKEGFLLMKEMGITCILKLFRLEKLMSIV